MFDSFLQGIEDSYSSTDDFFKSLMSQKNLFNIVDAQAKKMSEADKPSSGPNPDWDDSVGYPSYGAMSKDKKDNKDNTDDSGGFKKSVDPFDIERAWFERMHLLSNGGAHGNS